MISNSKPGKLVTPNLSINKKVLESRNLSGISFVGPIGSGKTTLITRLLDRLTDKFTIGYIKDNAPRLDLDKDIKDSLLARQHGASVIVANDASSSAAMGNLHSSLLLKNLAFAFSEIVFLETHHYDKIPAVRLLGEHENPEDVFRSGGNMNVLCFAGRSRNIKNTKIPYFCIDSISEISDFLINHLQQTMKKVKINALFLRNTENTELFSALNSETCFNLENITRYLSKHCSKMFFAHQELENQSVRFCQIPMLKDKFTSNGVFGSIISAMITYPSEAWIVIPVVSVDLLPILKSLIENRNPLKMATVIYDLYKKQPEWIPAIYEPKSKIAFTSNIGLNLQSLFSVIPQAALQKACQINFSSILKADSVLVEVVNFI